MRRNALLSLTLAATLSYAAPALAVDRWDSDYAPPTLAVHLASLKAGKVDVREIGFAPSGQWIAVSANGVATSSASLFDVGTFGLRDALVKAHPQRLVVTALAAPMATGCSWRRTSSSRAPWRPSRTWSARRWRGASP
ncbi:MAG: hypothetical protein U0183_12070 [Polyangiaceae bacterium]